MKIMTFLKSTNLTAHRSKTINITFDVFQGKKTVCVFKNGEAYNPRKRFDFTVKGLEQALTYADKQLTVPEVPEKKHRKPAKGE